MKQLRVHRRHFGDISKEYICMFRKKTKGLTENNYGYFSWSQPSDQKKIHLRSDKDRRPSRADIHEFKIYKSEPKARRSGFLNFL